MKAYTKDVIRTIIKGKKRFFAIMLIAALGVCMLTGLKASCEDLRYSADKFFDKQNLFDISVVSTLGLTEEDVEVLLRLDGVEDAEGTYSETVFTTHDGKMKQAIMQVLSERGINVPYLLDGEMPQKADEILVTEKYLTETGKEIGDTIVIEEDMDSDSDIKKEEFKSDTEDINKKNGVVKEITQENIKSKTNERPEWNTSFNEETENKTSDIDSDEERESKTSDSENKTSNTNDFEIEIEEEEETPNFLYTTYTIVGVVIDITDINSNEGAVAFRSNSTTDYTFFILPEAVSSDVYTAVYLTLNDCDELLCYSEEYEEQVDEIVDILEAEIKEDREKVRYDKITGEALEKIEDAESEMNDKFSEAEEEIDSAKTEIADGWIEIFDGEIDLEKGERELAKAERELQKAQRQLERAERELDFGEKEI
ncbi:MAG: hypothetical protein IKJ01_01905, partial [Lachnospiraceae bacterium]|nr:hypothetical protein [Lachnospiraceae bacterium]